MRGLGGGLCFGGLFEGRDIVWPRALLCGKGGLEIGISDRAIGDPRGIPFARHGHGNAPDTAQSRARLGQGLARLAKIGVHRDRRGQRPDGRDGAGACVTGFGEGG